MILPSGPEPPLISEMLMPFSFAKVFAAGLAKTRPPSGDCEVFFMGSSADFDFSGSGVEEVEA